jgi:hypothetical protein
MTPSPMILRTFTVTLNVIVALTFLHLFSFGCPDFIAIANVIVTDSICIHSIARECLGGFHAIWYEQYATEDYSLPHNF